MSKEIRLGDVARDTISGFQGVVIAETKWLHGCRRFTLAPQEVKDGKLLDTNTFDEPQLERVEPKVAAGYRSPAASIRS